MIQSGMMSNGPRWSGRRPFRWHTLPRGDDLPVEDFSHCNLRAPAVLLDALRDFYVQVVGLREGPRPRFRSRGYWLYAGDQDVVHLSEAKPDEERQSFVQGTFDHLAFRCTDEASHRRNLDSRGIVYTIDRVPQTGAVQYFFSDPAGNGVELNFGSD